MSKFQVYLEKAKEIDENPDLDFKGKPFSDYDDFKGDDNLDDGVNAFEPNKVSKQLVEKYRIPKESFKFHQGNEENDYIGTLTVDPKYKTEILKFCKDKEFNSPTKTKDGKLLVSLN